MAAVVEGSATKAGLGYWLLSSDTHVVEPADLFPSRIAAKYRDVAPQLMMVDGVERFGVEGTPLHKSTAAFGPGDRFLDERPVRSELFAECVEDCANQVSEWLAANERDGVWGGAVFPSGTLVYYGVSDRGRLVEILRVYNEYIAEFASQAPERIKAVGLLNPDDLPGAVRMAEQMKADGFGGLMLPVKALDGHTYESAEFEPLWEAIEGLAMPLTVHIAAHRSPLAGQLMFARIGESLPASDYHVRVSITDMIFSGVFERHPNLQVVSVEHEGSWVFHYLQRMDWHYINNRTLQDGYRFKDGRLPSDLFRQNVVISFTEDGFLVKNRHVIGVDNLAWGSDFPHHESLYSMSHASLAHQFDGVPEDERVKMSVTNTARLYGLELPPVRE